MFDHFADAIRAVERFGEPDLRTVEWQQDYPRAEWLDLSATTGLLTRLSPRPLTTVLDGMGRAIDDLGGAVPVRFTTFALLAERDPRVPPCRRPDTIGRPTG